MNNKRTSVALTSESIIRIKKWQGQLRTQKEGMEATCKALVNWLITNAPENLNDELTNELIEKFYTEESYLRKKLRELKNKKSS